MTVERVFDQPPAGLVMRGNWTVTRQSGDVSQVIARHNVVCTNGKEFLASFLYSAALAASTFTCKYMAIGTDTTAENAAQTALGAEVARQTGTVSYVSNQMYVVTGTFPSGTGTGSIAEYGLLSSSTGGTLLSRTVQTVIAKGANDSLTAVLQITFS